jgi:hypothetical protein
MCDTTTTVRWGSDISHSNAWRARDWTELALSLRMRAYNSSSK